MAFRGRGPRFFPPPTDAHRINRHIRAPQVRLIGAEGEPLGVVDLADALRRADEAQLDLVEVAPTAQPPVCRILDYGKFKYQQHKKEAEARRKQTNTTVKELRLGYRTDVGDMERQIAKAREFLAEGDRVKFTLRFRGREMAYQDLGRKKMMRVCEALADVATIEGHPRMEGRLMGLILAPQAKKKAAPVPKSATKPTAKVAAASPESSASAAAPAASPTEPLPSPDKPQPANA